MVAAAELKQLQALERGLESSEKVDFNATVEYLALVRKLQLRRPAQVARYGLDLLNEPSMRRRLGDEVYDVLEQVAVAAMDINSLDVAKECIGALMLKFKKSARVGRLEGMWLEAKGWWGQAERVYESLLQDHPQDQRLLRRQVTLLRSQGKLLEASECLRRYLDTYQADMDAWRELADLYLSLSMLRQAGFCQEELLLSNPTNPLYNCMYAETLYTLGGPENLRASRAYYTAAIEHSAGECVRALWGLLMAEAALRQANARNAKSTSSEIGVLAAETLTQMYKCKQSSNEEASTVVISRLLAR